MERRLRPRKQAAVYIYLACPGQRVRRYRTANISAQGVFVEANLLTKVTRGVTVDLVFVLSYGSLVRIHRRRARVSHVSRRGAGMMLFRSGEPRSPLDGTQVLGS